MIKIEYPKCWLCIRYAPDEDDEVCFRCLRFNGGDFTGDYFNRLREHISDEELYGLPLTEKEQSQ